MNRQIANMSNGFIEEEIKNARKTNGSNKEKNRSNPTKFEKTTAGRAENAAEVQKTREEPCISQECGQNTRRKFRKTREEPCISQE